MFVDKSPLFELTYIGLTYIAFITVTGVIGIDGLFIGLCFLITAQFQIIKSQIDNLIEQEIGRALILFFICRAEN